MSKPKYYALAVGEAGLERYEILNHLCNPLSLDFIRQMNIKADASILDVGCGIGLMSCELAALAGPKSNIVGIDASSEQVTTAKQIAQQLNHPNIQFFELFAEDVDKLNRKFDLVYCRFLLNTQKNPEKLLAKMSQMLSPDGILVCEEPHSIDSFFCYPSSVAYDGWKNNFLKLQQASGKHFVFDFLIGQKLYQWYQNLGLKIFHTRAIQPLLHTPYEKRQLRLQMTELMPTLIKFGLATSDEIEQLIHDLNNFENDESRIASFFPFLQISGAF